MNRPNTYTREDDMNKNLYLGVIAYIGECCSDPHAYPVQIRAANSALAGARMAQLGRRLSDRRMWDIGDCYITDLSTDGKKVTA